MIYLVSSDKTYNLDDSKKIEKINLISRIDKLIYESINKNISITKNEDVYEGIIEGTNNIIN